MFFCVFYFQVWVIDTENFQSPTAASGFSLQ